MPVSGADGSWLLDTGPLVALLSKHDDAHERCVEALDSLRGRPLTTEAVLTEAVYLVGPRGATACIDFIVRIGAVIVTLNPRRLARCRDLIARYHDIPMDFADATLVALADILQLPTVFTLDRRGFNAYRWQKNRRFTIVP